MPALDKDPADAAIDRAIRQGGGSRFGSMELRDLAGMDVGLRVASSLHKRLGDDKSMPPAGLKGRVAGGAWAARPKKAFTPMNRTDPFEL